jgi:hypothetical protein
MKNATVVPSDGDYAGSGVTKVAGFKGRWPWDAQTLCGRSGMIMMMMMMRRRRMYIWLYGIYTVYIRYIWYIYINI